MVAEGRNGLKASLLIQEPLERERQERQKTWDSDVGMRCESSKWLGGHDLGQWSRGLELEKDASYPLRQEQIVEISVGVDDTQLMADEWPTWALSVLGVRKDSKFIC